MESTTEADLGGAVIPGTATVAAVMEPTVIENEATSGGRAPRDSEEEVEEADEDKLSGSLPVAVSLPESTPVAWPGNDFAG